MNDAFSEARKTAARAISPGSPTRPRGTVLASAAFRSAVPVKRLSMPVSVGPGFQCLAFRFAASRCDDACAFLGKGHGSGAADAGQCAGDQHDGAAHFPLLLIGSALPAEFFRDRDHLVSTSSQKATQ